MKHHFGRITFLARHRRLLLPLTCVLSIHNHGTFVHPNLMSFSNLKAGECGEDPNAASGSFNGHTQRTPHTAHEEGGGYRGPYLSGNLDVVRAGVTFKLHAFIIF